MEEIARRVLELGHPLHLDNGNVGNKTIHRSGRHPSGRIQLRPPEHSVVFWPHFKVRALLGLAAVKIMEMIERRNELGGSRKRRKRHGGPIDATGPLAISMVCDQ